MWPAWKKLLIAMAISAVGVAQATGLTEVVPAAYVGIALFGLGLVMSWLVAQSDLIGKSTDITKK